MKSNEILSGKRSVIFVIFSNLALVVIIFLNFYCSSETIGPIGGNDINPIRLFYSVSKENSIKNIYTSMLNKYRINNVISYQFNSITSNLTNLNLKDSVRIFTVALNMTDAKAICSKYSEFYTEWQDLFGAGASSLDFTNGFVYTQPGNNYLKVYQSTYNGRKYKLAKDPYIKFVLAGDGSLISIESTIIPEYVIPEPSKYDVNKMMDNIYGKTLPVNNSSVTFSSEYTLKEEDSFWIYSKIVNN